MLIKNVFFAKFVNDFSVVSLRGKLFFLVFLLFDGNQISSQHNFYLLSLLTATIK